MGEIKKNIEMEYSEKDREYIIKIPARLLETKEGIEYFHDCILRGISDDALVKEQLRRIRLRNRDWVTWDKEVV